MGSFIETCKVEIVIFQDVYLHTCVTVDDVSESGWIVKRGLVEQICGHTCLSTRYIQLSDMTTSRPSLAFAPASHALHHVAYVRRLESLLTEDALSKFNMGHLRATGSWRPIKRVLKTLARSRGLLGYIVLFPNSEDKLRRQLRRTILLSKIEPKPH